MFHVPPPDAEAEPVEPDGRELHTPASPHPDPAPRVLPPRDRQRRRGGVQEEHVPVRSESKLSGAHCFTRRHLSGEAARGGPSSGYF